MKAKYALIILIVGFALSIIGAMFKIMHWPFASDMLMVSTAMQVIGCITLLYKLVTYPKIKDFLDR